MLQLDKRLLDACKEAITDTESKKFPDFLSSFTQRQDKARRPSGRCIGSFNFKEQKYNA